MTLKELLRKRSNIQATTANSSTPVQGQRQLRPGSDSTAGSERDNSVPEFTFIRTTTSTQEVIEPPSFPGDPAPHVPAQSDGQEVSPEKKRHFFKRSASNSSQHKDKEVKEKVRVVSNASLGSLDSKNGSPPTRPKPDRKLSERFTEKLRLSKSPSKEGMSAHLPENLGDAPEAVPAPVLQDIKSKEGSTSIAPAQLDKREKEAREALWEKRATQLAFTNAPSETPSPSTAPSIPVSVLTGSPSKPTPFPTPPADDNESRLQEAIRLHESGSLPASTALFADLAQPSGANNALAQVLYGLALRHGWGISPDASAAIHYLRLAASNSATTESQALSSGLAAGGSAKGELTLAIFELANCLRYGWGVDKDPVAARVYYETAANLGDPDAMEESAWCWMEGYGGRKDRGVAARYLRRAEGLGRKGVGNSWIWKAKYDA